MAWVDQKLSYYSLDAIFYEESVKLEDFGQGEGGHTVYIEPCNKDAAHNYAFILRKAAQHLERLGRSLPTEAEIRAAFK